MTIATAPPIAPVAQAVIDEANAILNTPEVQAIDAPLAAKIPAKVRGTIYEVAKWVGLIGAGATAAAGLLDGQAAFYISTAGFLLVGATNLLAKAHLSTT